MKTSAVESQITDFLGKYDPGIEAQLREARTRLRAHISRGFELVFDNYNALVFALSPTERRSDAFLSVVGYPKWVTLFFLYGTELQDPQGLLQGEGKQVRSIRLKAASDLDRPEVEALITQALARHATAFQEAPPLSTVIKSALEIQRPRRPAPKK